MNTLVLRRKLLYIGAIVLLLVPLYFLGHPSVRTKGGPRQSDTTLRPGGALAQIRTKYGLHHSDLGELDPASESARLATLGLRGVAATILWQKAEGYKREKYYDRLAATVNQLRILQPHFVKVWEFQAHNLAWNVSVEFDDYKQRYEWVKKGIHFLIDGSKYNKNRTEMPFELGFAFGNKLGMSDERFQFRELYRNDRNFHNEVEERTGLDLTQVAAQGPDSKPDNWRAGVLWYNEAYQMVDRGAPMAKSPLMFYCKAGQWQYKHAEAVQLDGYLGEEARNAWKIAGTAWHDYGQRPIRTSFGTTIFLNELESAKSQYTEQMAKFEAVCGDVYQDAHEEKLSELTDEKKAILAKDYSKLSFTDLQQIEYIKKELEVSPDELIRRLPESKQVEAAEIASQLRTLAEKIEHVSKYRDQINFTYWATRCEAEQEDAALAARTNMFEADTLVDLGKLKEAIEKYDLAWVHWNDLFNKYPAMIVDDAADEVEVAIERYKQYLDREEGLPDDFPLTSFLKFREIYRDDLSQDNLMGVVAKWPSLYPDRNFLDEMLASHEAENLSFPKIKPILGPQLPEGLEESPEAAKDESDQAVDEATDQGNVDAENAIDAENAGGESPLDATAGDPLDDNQPIDAEPDTVPKDASEPQS